MRWVPAKMKLRCAVQRAWLLQTIDVRANSTLLRVGKVPRRAAATKYAMPPVVFAFTLNKQPRPWAFVAAPLSTTTASPLRH